MYQLTYNVYLKDLNKEKEFLDDIRVRNGNLPVVSSHIQTTGTDL